MTGRANYAAVTQQCRAVYTGVDVDFVASPEQMASTPGAERSAVGFWLMKGLHHLADQGDDGDAVDRITAVVNPKTDSFSARRDNFVVALAALG